MARGTTEHHCTPSKQGDIDAWLATLRCFLSSSRKKIRPFGKKSTVLLKQTAQAKDAEEKLLKTQMRMWLGGLEQHLGSAGRWHGIRPAVVITTTPGGIRACESLVREPELATLFESCCYLTEYEYRYWCKEEPDIKFKFHINYWAWIKTSVPSVRMHEFRMYPIPKDNKYWLLRHGVNGLGEHDYADCQIHSWDGASTKLLAEHFHEGVPSV